MNKLKLNLNLIDSMIDSEMDNLNGGLAAEKDTNGTHVVMGDTSCRLCTVTVTRKPDGELEWN
ncbi:MAG: hypothetical protein LBF27_31205 [Sphingobacterium sp.]|jgi:hypothetical protein|nr:hypothetical protein [Sphingobacterium sp.]